MFSNSFIYNYNVRHEYDFIAIIKCIIYYVGTYYATLFDIGIT